MIDLAQISEPSPWAGQGEANEARQVGKPPINLWALAESQEQALPLQGGNCIIGELGPSVKYLDAKVSPGRRGRRKLRICFRSYQSLVGLGLRQAEAELDGKKARGLG